MKCDVDLHTGKFLQTITSNPSCDVVSTGYVISGNRSLTKQTGKTNDLFCHFLQCTAK